MKNKLKKRLRLILALIMSFSGQFAAGYWFGSNLPENITMSIFFYALWIIGFLGLMGMMIMHVKEEG